MTEIVSEFRNAPREGRSRSTLHIRPELRDPFNLYDVRLDAPQGVGHGRIGYKFHINAQFWNREEVPMARGMGRLGLALIGASALSLVIATDAAAQRKFSRRVLYEAWLAPSCQSTRVHMPESFHTARTNPAADFLAPFLVRPEGRTLQTSESFAEVLGPLIVVQGSGASDRLPQTLVLTRGRFARAPPGFGRAEPSAAPV